MARESDPPDHEVTRLLMAIRAGDTAAEDRLVRLLYEDLRRVAERLMKAERRGHTLRPTALVHESYLRIRHRLGTLTDRRHFFRAMRQAMQRVLIDYARARHAAKRDPAAVQAGFRPAEEADGDQPGDAASACTGGRDSDGRSSGTGSAPETRGVWGRRPERAATWPRTPTPVRSLYLDLHAALEELGRFAPRERLVVEYRWLLGLTIEETASLLGVSSSTVEKDWRIARAWLYQRLRRSR
jgi:RNA polymerase sigma factor (sigma-70 family)